MCVITDMFLYLLLFIAILNCIACYITACYLNDIYDSIKTVNKHLSFMYDILNKQSLSWLKEQEPETYPAHKDAPLSLPIDYKFNSESDGKPL